MENQKHPTWGGKRPGQGRPKKEVKNAKRQISVPPELDAKIVAFAEKEGLSYSAAVVKLVQSVQNHPHF